jgi:hypothetical protein
MITNQRRLGLTTLLFLGVCATRLPSAHADGSYEECKQILDQDLFNKFRSGATTSSTTFDELAKKFESTTDDAAYQRYSYEFDEAHKRGTNINAEGHYLIAGGEFNLALNAEDKLSEKTFKELRSRERSQVSSYLQSKKQSSQTAASILDSQVRDAESVRAWRDCVVKQHESGVYARSSRDQAGRVYVNVMWIPGALAGAAPSIPISFVNNGTGDGYKVLAEPKEVIAVGSGRSFAVECGKVCDQGFTIAFNATAYADNGKVLSSFTNSVEVPPLAPSPEKVQEQLAARGTALAAQDPRAEALRNQQPDEQARRGFDIGMAVAEGHTLPGPGKNKRGDSLPVGQQIAYRQAVEFSVERNRTREFGDRGILVVQRDPQAAAHRNANPSPFYWLGFDIGAGLFADAASGGAGHTLEGPGSGAIRDGLVPEGQLGFRAAVNLFLVEKRKVH